VSQGRIRPWRENVCAWNFLNGGSAVIAHWLGSRLGRFDGKFFEYEIKVVEGLSRERRAR
jgi:hypothetical protein